MRKVTQAKLKYRQMKKGLALSRTDNVFIMLIIFWHFYVYEEDKFRAQLSKVEYGTVL